MVALGAQIRQIYLHESQIVEEYITVFKIDGDCVVGKPNYKEMILVDDFTTTNRNDPPYPMGRVHINETQYFDTFLKWL